MHQSKPNQRGMHLRQRYIQLLSVVLTLIFFKYVFSISLFHTPQAAYLPLRLFHTFSPAAPREPPDLRVPLPRVARPPPARRRNARRARKKKPRRKKKQWKPRVRPSPQPPKTWQQRMLEKLPPDQPGCLPYILFDKPVKTGSTAITRSLYRYFMGHSASAAVCTMETCTQIADDICAGRRNRTHIISHIKSNATLVQCLRDKGYYVVTSVRDPLARWTSSYMYNRMMNASHYGINSTEGYSAFMGKMPDCSLFDYYDGLGESCPQDMSMDDVRKRADDIVRRFDEVIDLYGESKGELYSRIKQWLGMKNVSPPADTAGDYDAKRMDREKVLYQRILERSRELPDSKRFLCHRIGT